MPAALAWVSALRRKLWVLAPSISAHAHAALRPSSTRGRPQCLQTSRGAGKTQSDFSKSRLNTVGHKAFHSAMIDTNLGLIGTSRVAIFFFVIIRGNTTVSCMMFSHRNIKHSDIRHAVNLHIESAARNFGGQ